MEIQLSKDWDKLYVLHIQYGYQIIHITQLNALVCAESVVIQTQKDKTFNKVCAYLQLFNDLQCVNTAHVISLARLR